MSPNDSSGDKGSEPAKDDKGSELEHGKSLTSFARDGRIIIVFAVIGAIVLISLSSAFEHVPSNWRESQFSNENLTVFVRHPSNLMLPVRNMFVEQPYSLFTTIYHDPAYKIDNVTLSTPSDSVLTYDGFMNIGNSSKNPLTFHLPLKAMHSGEVRNITTPQTVSILYHKIQNNIPGNDTIASNATAGVPFHMSDLSLQQMDQVNNTSLKTFSFTLGLPVKMMNFSNIVYLFIVFIGVFVSRYMHKYYANKIEEDNKPQKDNTDVNRKTTPKLNQDDLIWLFASGIITLLIFSSFQDQVELQSSLITNISLAFTFGFGFDKLIETATFLVKKKT